MTNPYAEFLQRDECLMLFVDIQGVMLDPCDEAARLKKNAAALLDIAEILKIPVIFTVHNAEKLGGALPDLVGKVARPRILNKLELSCFENEEIGGALMASARRTLIIAGLETHVCVFHTAAHGLRLGYTVHVAADAVASRSPFNWEIGLKRMEKAGAVISSTEMIVFELLNRAGTPEFRAALPLLKTF
ncbi:MAG: isochorismatase family protein [Syntrophobacteraceae bacterium]|nr:isochorismatase family protein [Syntrophobacteraceae bacterium]